MIVYCVFVIVVVVGHMPFLFFWSSLILVRKLYGDKRRKKTESLCYTMGKFATETFTNGPFDPVDVKGCDAVSHVLEQAPYAFLVVTRNYNGNVMVYEAYGRKNEMKVTNYWLILEPSYREKRRQKNLNHDRENMNFAEKFVYGYQAEKRKSFLKFSIRPLRGGGGAEGEDGVDYSLRVAYIKDRQTNVVRAKAIYQHRDGHLYVINHVHVCDNGAKEESNMSVPHIELKGYNARKPTQKFYHKVNCSRLGRNLFT
jgi:hypothetical protein